MAPSIYVFADGSCSGKGYDVGAWAACVVTASGRRQLLYGTAYPTTINRCELIPIMEGLRWAKANLKRLPIRVYTDSEFTAKAASGVYAPEENLDLWAGYAEIAAGLNVEVKWRERNSHFYMELCDALASTLRKGQIEISSRLFPDWKMPEAELPDNVALPHDDDINIMKGIQDADSAFRGLAPGN